MKKVITLAIISIVLMSCIKTKEGMIVKDINNNYYMLQGEEALGSERYRVIDIDTTKFKTF